MEERRYSLAAYDSQFKGEVSKAGLEIDELFLFRSTKADVPEGSIFNHAPTDGYEIRGGSRKLKLSHSISWTVGEQQQDASIKRTSDTERRYIAKGCPASDNFEQMLGERSELVTKRALQEKSFGDVLFDYFSEKNTAKQNLEHAIQQDLNAFSADFGVVIESVTTVMDRIPEAAFLTGKTVSTELTAYPLAEAGQTIELRFDLKDLVLMEARRDQLRQHLNADNPNAVDEVVAAVVSDAVRAHVGGMSLLAFMESVWGDGRDRTLEDELKLTIKERLLSRFGLDLNERDISIGTGSNPLVKLRRELRGLGDDVAIRADALSQAHGDARFIGVLHLDWRIQDICETEEAMMRFIDLARSLRTTELVRAEISRTLEATIQNVLVNFRREVFVKEAFQKRRFAEVIAQIGREEVANATGIHIEIPPRQMRTAAEGADGPEVLAALQESLAKLQIREVKLLETPELESEDKRDLNRTREAIERVETRLKSELKRVDVEGAEFQAALDETSARLLSYVEDCRFTQVDMHLLLTDERAAGSPNND